MGKGYGGLPDRWLDYIPIGKQIIGIPIIACKVPLKEELVRYKLKPQEWFTPDMLMERVPNVGCIVDLTATTRYYCPSAFQQRGVQHEKILCEGHVVPSQRVVNRFFSVLDEFLNGVQSRAGKVLMVHCTHGLNRTGYLVSRYMVQRRGMTPGAAIAAFNEARGHDMERANYISHLHTLTPGEESNPDAELPPAPERSFADVRQRERPEAASRPNQFNDAADRNGRRDEDRAAADLKRDEIYRHGRSHWTVSSRRDDEDRYARAGPSASYHLDKPRESERRECRRNLRSCSSDRDKEKRSSSLERRHRRTHRGSRGGSREDEPRRDNAYASRYNEHYLPHYDPTQPPPPIHAAVPAYPHRAPSPSRLPFPQFDQKGHADRSHSAGPAWRERSNSREHRYHEAPSGSSGRRPSYHGDQGARGDSRDNYGYRRR